MPPKILRPVHEADDSFEMPPWVLSANEVQRLSATSTLHRDTLHSWLANIRDADRKESISKALKKTYDAVNAIINFYLSTLTAESSAERFRTALSNACTGIECANSALSELTAVPVAVAERSYANAVGGKAPLVNSFFSKGKFDRCKSLNIDAVP